jgi:cystathionine gamma-synthase
MKKGTSAVWSGETGRFPGGATTPPIVNSVTYSYDDIDEWFDVATGRKPGHIYSRNTNPTVRVLEEKLGALEGAESAIAFSTGMGAISNVLFTFLRPGKRVVSLKDTYGGTSRLFLDFLPSFNVDVELCDTTDFDAIETAVAKGCDLLYLETPTNPTLKIVDIARLAMAGKKAGAVVVVDNTFATPINQSPLQLGADLVVHSATKYLCGHSDAMGGLLAGGEDLVRKVFQFREINGASLQAEPAYLIARGMKTLELRIERQNKSAMTIAEHLKGHAKVQDVFYPGLSTHPGHDIARAQMSGFGGMMSFSVHGGYEKAKLFLSKLQLAHRAASLGSVSTLAGPPRTTSHVELTEEQRALLGIPESLIRYSVGIENVEDLLADLDKALQHI